MRAAVISDTHLRAPNAFFEAVYDRWLAPADYIFHCGDHTGFAVWSHLLQHPGHVSVAGNCDYGALEPMDGLAAFDQTIMFYTHGHMYGVKYDLDTLTDAAAARGAEVALFGHTHVPHAEQRGKVFLFNPGSCGRCYTGPDTYGLLTLENGKVTAYEHKEVPKQ